MQQTQLLSEHRHNLESHVNPRKEFRAFPKPGPQEQEAWRGWKWGHGGKARAGGLEGMGMGRQQEQEIWRGWEWGPGGSRSRRSGEGESEGLGVGGRSRRPKGSGSMEGDGMWPFSGKGPRGGVTARCAGYVTWDP